MRSHPAKDSGGPDSQAFPEEASPSGTRELQTLVQPPESTISLLALCSQIFPFLPKSRNGEHPMSLPAQAQLATHSQRNSEKNGLLLKPLRDHHSETPTHDMHTQAFWEQT